MARNATAARPMERKLTTKSIMGEKVNANILQGADSKQLYVIGGIARSTFSGSTDFGPYIGFKGEFIAKRSDGEVFRAPKAFLPEPLQGMIEDQLAQVGETEDGKPAKRQVEFMAIIGIEKDASTIGFKYTVEPVLAAQESDALAGLLERAEAVNPNLLPAPKRRSKKDE